MPIVIDHITIAARDKEASMEWMAREVICRTIR
jgi:hypothetical protein